MIKRAFATAIYAVLVACTSASSPHDEIRPFPQPKPTKASEEVALKFKPQLFTSRVVCVPYPAVDASGTVSGGLKASNGNEDCKFAEKGSQVYGRAMWYQNLYAIMYSWYFPKRFWLGFPTKRHDWKSVVVWIKDPSEKTRKIVGVSMSKSLDLYNTKTELYPNNFARIQVSASSIVASNTSLRFEYYEFGMRASYLKLTGHDGQYQDLILWEQLTPAARKALNNDANFYDAIVPFSDKHFKAQIVAAYPLALESNT
ncbi:hypothetical protein CCR75_003840 [Bremia lactucae]|uniref:Necrosis inducing protein NPP1 n=1 Tax=Bremia lactucae TaxID=4779 RepID=A0A976NZX7_BRELC|nr:hypothetical protein CCR75_003840 [Bremia lactucae]